MCKGRLGSREEGVVQAKEYIIQVQLMIKIYFHSKRIKGYNIIKGKTIQIYALGYKGAYTAGLYVFVECT